MTQIIQSAANAAIKEIASLKHRKSRQETGLFVMEGVRAAEEAVDSGWPLASLAYTSEAAQHPRVQSLLGRAAVQNARLLEVAEPVFRKITQTEQPQGVLAVLRKKEFRLEDCFKGDAPFIAVLDQVQDPGNVGTILRTADAAGCSGVLLTRGCADLFSGKTLRASMGSVFHLPVLENCEAADLIVRLRSEGAGILATALDVSAKAYYDVDFAGPVALVFGNEGNGVGAEFLGQADQKIHIPIHGKAESLNVAAAAAILLFEAVRRRVSIL